MNAVVRNTFIQGSLSIVFAAVVLLVAFMAIWVSMRSIGKTLPTTEEPFVPTRTFAPAGLLMTKAEREVQEQRNAHDAEHGIDRTKHGAHA
ncbi:hypothetical protein [Brevibacterium samyangense]|uniref:Uncharacterized protein n=1 Tax=Brevibacterium samyangense TaxID=366888 RepID=A0ABN2TIU4_9MICO